jgi:hypothetical protein
MSFAPFSTAERARRPRIEPTQAKLRGHHHQAEQQCDRRHVDGIPCFVQRHASGGDEGDGAEQRDARPIETQPGQAAQHHPEVDKAEDRDDDGFHLTDRSL